MCSFKVSAPLIYRRYDLEASWAFSSTQIWRYYLDLTIRASSKTIAGPPLSLRASIELTYGSRNFIFFKTFSKLFILIFCSFQKNNARNPRRNTDLGGGLVGGALPSNVPFQIDLATFLTWFRPCLLILGSEITAYFRRRHSAKFALLVTYDDLNIDLSEKMTERFWKCSLSAIERVFRAFLPLLVFELGDVVILNPIPHQDEGGWDRHHGAD